MTDLPDSTRWQLWIVASASLCSRWTPPSLTPRFPQCAKPRGKSVAYAHGHCLLCTTVAVMLPASGWLADKVGVRKFSLPPSCCLLSVHCFARFPDAERTVAGTRVTGRWRRDDGPVGRLTVMKIVPREQYMAAIPLSRCPVRSGRCLARRSAVSGGVRIVALDLFDQHSGGNYGAIATLMLMPNYTMQTRRFDSPAFCCWRLAWRY